MINCIICDGHLVIFVVSFKLLAALDSEIETGFFIHSFFIHDNIDNVKKHTFYNILPFTEFISII